MTETGTRRLLTAAELASALQTTTGNIMIRTRAGKIPSVRVSPKVIRYDLDDVLRHLKGNGSGAGESKGE